MITIDSEKGIVTQTVDGQNTTFPIGSEQAFAAVSKAMLRVGWDTKYVYSFTWLGRPIIQLPDDMIRLQEAIYRVKPDVILEIGIAHGGSLVFSAHICKAIGKGRVIGVDIEIRSHNRKAIEQHNMFDIITLIEGNSVSESTYNKVKDLINQDEKVLVFLDGCHTKEHVYKELCLYTPLIGVNSYIVAMDGIQQDLVGAPRSKPDWNWNNSAAAAELYVEEHPDYEIENPEIPFNEGLITKHYMTYWPNAFIRRKK